MSLCRPGWGSIKTGSSGLRFGSSGGQFKESETGMRSNQLDKRAQSLAAMGLVTREGSRYHVKTAAAHGRQESYEVWRDENGRIRCSCPEFERLSAEAP